jgi:hypothetical protein
MILRVKRIIEKISIKKLLILGAGTVFVFFVLFKTMVDFKMFVSTVQDAKVDFLFYAFIAILPTFILSPLRWFYILKAYELDIDFKRTFLVVTASWSFVLIPGRLGDFTRSYFIKDQVPIVRSVGTIVLEKIMDIIVLLLLVSVGLILLGQYAYSLISLAFILAIFVGVASFKQLSLKLGMARLEFFKKITESLTPPKNKRFLIKASLFSTANWLTSIISTYFLFLAFGAHAPLTSVIAYFPITIFAGLLPITIAGIGVRDGAIMGLFAGYATVAQSLAVGISYSFLGYFLLMMVGIPVLIFYLSKNKQNFSNSELKQPPRL